MMSLEEAKAALSELEADKRMLETRAADIERLHSAAIIERDDARAAVAKSIVDGGPEKRREALVAAEVKADAAVRSMDLARGEVATRLDRLAGRRRRLCKS